MSKSNLSGRRKIEFLEKISKHLKEIFENNPDKIPLHKKYAVKIDNIRPFLRKNNYEEHFVSALEDSVEYRVSEEYIYLSAHEEEFSNFGKKNNKKTDTKSSDKEHAIEEKESMNLEKQKKKVLGFLKHMTTKGYIERKFKPNKEGYIDLQKFKSVASEQKKEFDWDSLNSFIKDEFEIKGNMIKVGEKKTEKEDSMEAQAEIVPVVISDTKISDKDNRNKRKGLSTEPNAKLPRQDEQTNLKEMEEKLVNFLNYGCKRYHVSQYQGFVYLEDIETNINISQQTIKEIANRNPKFELEVEGSTNKAQIRIFKRAHKETPVDVMISKKLSSILRHNAENCGLKLDSGGFLFVNEILNLREFVKNEITEMDIKRIVENNEKQRFYMTTDETTNQLKIRANQGHSLNVENLELEEVTVDTNLRSVIHGTYWKFWKLIEKEGLKRQRRNHIHFAESDPSRNQVISGMRSSCDVTIYINWKLALADGIKFFISANNVILCPGDKDGVLSPKYFEKVLDRKTGKAVFP
ncbi:DgyrCDS6897 [Dimorphilus gyrociliatus]|uniref:2'-phosphotransferase n=1 Tax=Dimorphilus gyrociliatus TaxID=2664684 RepID=A0A7I8VPC4_9ANNE|nr:DgyrCDS6897 [Dimorphilus gyrociliatus]